MPIVDEAPGMTRSDPCNGKRGNEGMTCSTRRYSGLRLPACALVLSILLLAPAAAQTPAEFYAGRTVELIIGYGPGAAYDSNGRVVARHLAKHIPGKPTIVVRNMPGAGSLVSTNHIYNAAPRDGSTIGLFSRGNAMYPLLESGAKFEAQKLNWIGSSSKETSFVLSLGTSAFKTVEDLRRVEMLVGATGAGADTVVMPAILNATIGTKMKPVTGYPGNAEALLALERGEVQGTGAMSIGTIRTARPDWLTSGKVNFLIQLALEKHPTLFKQVPLALDLATDPVNRQSLELVMSRQAMAYPFAAPPGVPADRIAALRAAFMATMKDPEFIADAQKAGFEVDPVSGEEIADIIKRVYGAPREAIERARSAVAQKK
jgi:tripartite-type tricarboxylate transporter receptor subunit TctC